MFRVYVKSGMWGEYITMQKAEEVANNLINKSWNRDEVHITDEKCTIIKKITK